MKITFISGSPRKDGNTANILALLAQRLGSAAKVEILYLADYHINGCLGCSHHCQQSLHTLGCIQQDDVEKLLNKLIEADVIFYGTPLYGHSYSGQLKLFMDRHVALFKFVGGSDKAVSEMDIHSLISKKTVGLIVSCQGPEEENTELIKAQFDKFCESSLTHCIGKYIFPWCNPDAKQSLYPEDVLQQIVDNVSHITNPQV